MNLNNNTVAELKSLAKNVIEGRNKNFAITKKDVYDNYIDYKVRYKGDYSQTFIAKFDRYTGLYTITV